MRLLDQVFSGDSWRTIDSVDENERAEQCVAKLRAMVEAKWATYIKMLRNNRIRYFLLHLTKHPAGRELMKECIWQSCPEGGYYARQKDDPRQQLLITPEPDLKPVETWIRKQLTPTPKRWQQLLEATRDELWLNKHTNEVVKSLRRDGVITASYFDGKFAATNNPLLSLTG
jgi:hypothetical protein